ncbi:MAG: hypothetical protein HDT23_01855 [Ruminococcus sp.]|nr:hypothetical protein [Ruminococcus sp.]
MKSFKINNESAFFSIIFKTFTVLWIISFLLICPVIKVFVNNQTAFIFRVILLIIFVIGCYVASRTTTVEYGAEKVHWKWLWYDNMVNFSDVKSVRYHVIHEPTRYGYTHRFEMVFRLKNGSTVRLNDSLKSEDIDNIIDSTTDNIKLMQLYRFIEKLYPEKTKHH